MKHKNESGFTLVEILTGIIVIGVVSTCSWFAVSTLFRGEQLTRNRTLATNLLQKSQEELRRASLSFFDTLENCQFPGPSFIAGTHSTCALQVLGRDFNGYTRSVTTTLHSGSTEIKEAIITVNWTDQGNVLSQSSAVLIARPPMALPGNIIGTVRSSATGNLIPNAVVEVQLVGNTTRMLRISQTALGINNENFNFSNAGTGAFVVPVGTWRLTATHPSFTYNTPIPDIIVTSNTQTRADFLMDPNPQDAKINVQLVNAAAGNAAITNFANGYIFLLKDYANTNTIVDSTLNSTSKTFTIPFTDTNPKSFTIVNNFAYRSGWAARSSVSGTPSCTYAFNPHGWSSAIEQASGTLMCTNPFTGSAATDRITVNPGDNITVQVPLFPVPMATVRGRVVDETGVGLSGAYILARWPDVRGTVAWWWRMGTYPYAITDSTGNYVYSVPATQEMFANDATGALRLQAQKSLTFLNCCNALTSSLKYSPYVSVNNLFTGSVITAPDLVIPTLHPTDCGNVQGNVKDDSTGNALNGVTVTVQGSNAATVSTGDYIYQCSNPSLGFRLPAGSSKFVARKNGYYDYDSAGNMWYRPGPNVNILTNLVTTYDGKLWPIGTGTIIVNILDNQSGNPINGAEVKLTTYTGSQVTLTTTSSGQVTFNNVLETWPAVGLPSVAFYDTTTFRVHSLNVTEPSNIYDPVVNFPTPILQKGNTITINIRLVLKGGGT